MQNFTFTHEFMNTSLELQIVSNSKSQANGAASDAFFLVERIENALSMYIENSDVYGINSARVGDTLQVLDYTMQALEIASNIYQDTFGAVDVCLGQFFTNSKEQSNIKEPSRISLKIDKENFMIEKTSDGALDFGAIGKGYAVDKVASLLKEVWLIDNALINFGSSTILALGCDENNQEWKISFNGVDRGFTLKDSYALASSSLRTQTAHVLDPMSLTCPSEGEFCYYAHIKGSAAYADALSTAFLILSPDEIDEICKNLSVDFYKY